MAVEDALVSVYEGLWARISPRITGEHSKGCLTVVAVGGGIHSGECSVLDLLETTYLALIEW